MKINRIANTLALLSMLASSGAHATGIPVFDGAAAMNFLSSLENDATQITALQSQVTSLQRQIDMNTGSRGMGALATSSTASQWGGVLQGIMNTTGSYGQLIGNIIAQRTVLTAQQKGKLSPAHQEILARLWQMGAIQKVIAETTATKATQQLTEIQSLSAQIDQANDPKAIADLNAALSAKKLELDNTRMQLYAAEQQMQAEQRLIELRQRELAIARLGSRETSTVRIR